MRGWPHHGHPSRWQPTYMTQQHTPLGLSRMDLVGNDFLQSGLEEALREIEGQDIKPDDPVRMGACGHLCRAIRLAMGRTENPSHKEALRVLELCCYMSPRCEHKRPGLPSHAANHHDLSHQEVHCLYLLASITQRPFLKAWLAGILWRNSQLRNGAGAERYARMATEACPDLPRGWNTWNDGIGDCWVCALAAAKAEIAKQYPSRYRGLADTLARHALEDESVKLPVIADILKPHMRAVANDLKAGLSQRLGDMCHRKMAEEWRPQADGP